MKPSSAPSTPSPSPSIESSHFKGGRELNEDFKPDDTVVIIGRGKRIRSHSGNQRFYALIESELATYANAPSKTEKSYILAKVLEDIRNWSVERYGFVKLNPTTGRWHSPKDSVARVTVAQAFRDALAGQYSSSKHNKQRRRQIAKGFISEDEFIVASPVVGFEKDSLPMPVNLMSALEPRMIGPNMGSSLQMSNNMGMNMNTNMNMNSNMALRRNMNTHMDMGMGMDFRSNMNMNMNMNMGRKMSGQETLAHIRGIIQASTDQIGCPIDNFGNGMGMSGGYGLMNAGQWMPQSSMMMMNGPSQSFQNKNFPPSLGHCSNMMMMGQRSNEDYLYEPLPVEKDVHSGDAFAASEQSSSFFLQGA